MCTSFNPAIWNFRFKPIILILITYTLKKIKVMLTGRHFVRDVSCKKCAVKLGWIYEFAYEEGQRYKEGHVILERALISESEGF